MFNLDRAFQIETIANNWQQFTSEFCVGLSREWDKMQHCFRVLIARSARCQKKKIPNRKRTLFSEKGPFWIRECKFQLRYMCKVHVHRRKGERYLATKAKKTLLMLLQCMGWHVSGASTSVRGGTSVRGWQISGVASGGGVNFGPCFGWCLAGCGICGCEYKSVRCIPRVFGLRGSCFRGSHAYGGYEFSLLAIVWMTVGCSRNGSRVIPDTTTFSAVHTAM